MSKKIVHMLVYALLISYPFGVVFRIRIYENIQVVPQDIIVFLIFIASSIYFFRNKKQKEKNIFFYLQSLFILIGILSLIVNSLIYKDINFVAGVLYAFRYFMYLNLIRIGLFFRGSKTIGKAITLAGISIIIIGFTQFFFYNNLRNLFYLGWDDHLYRLFSSFFDPNFAGVFYALLFFFLAYIASVSRLKDGKVELIASFYSIIALYLTYSRTAFIALLSGILAYGIVKKRMRQFIVIFLVLGVMLFLVSDTSVEGLNPFRTASSGERIKSLSESLVIIEKNPLIGVGFDAFRYAQIRYGIRDRAGASISNADAGTDNSLLFVLATSGLLGLTIFCMSYLYLIRLLTQEHSHESTMLICIIVSLFGASLFLNVLFYTPIMTFVFLLIGLRHEFSIRVEK